MRKNRRLAKYTLLIGGLFVLGFFTAVAQRPQGRGGSDPASAFKRMDANGDGNITLAEYTASRGESRTRNRRGTNEPRRSYQDRMLDNLKGQMGASDEEWTKLKPPVEKILELRAQSMTSGFGRQRGAVAEMPEAVALREAIEQADTTPEVLKEKIAAFRTARARQEGALKTARAELSKLATDRQEAVLMIYGLLD